VPWKLTASTKAKMAVPLVMNAWYHAGAADVALELQRDIRSRL